MYSGIVDVILGQEAVQTADAALEVFVVGGHVVGADLVVDAAAGPPHRGDHVIAGLELGDVGADRFHLPEALMSDHEKVVAVGSGAVFGGIDFLVGAVDADLQDADQHAASVGHIVDTGLLQFGQVDGVALAGKHCDCFHFGITLLRYLVCRYGRNCFCKFYVLFATLLHELGDQRRSSPSGGWRRCRRRCRRGSIRGTG